ncbi:DUF4407 domain-containing protein [Nocardia puris]|uniref:Uncharacterized protein DUF4407 n=2 Tax=Nocardia puris TaxID=208602 RepID=A0A366DR00_9NOCA|nr:DUF4407 domain-containing protein [Nocardia puris]MBF6214172.1 DUF4407 domain-containing protein [Nocardia puris]MBF6365338.1 DUF4407 domain-containing protein [Nocardia puris]MBF6459740.1 DUF4407 domain-containing protein [Nocardia puris]RBO91714.1 uncharacterized protein DUF4407 [Nocardia puris]
MSITGLFTWLGGGRTGEIAEGHERTSYTLSGAVVALFALVAGGVVAAATAATGTWPAVAIVPVVLIVTLLAGALGRALATPRASGGPDRVGQIGRVAVAVLTGVLLAELASTVIFGGSVDRVLDEKAYAATESAPGVVAARAEAEQARADRATLNETITKAEQDIDRALVIARCEYNPTPECPQTRITGVPGRGPESQTANEMLDDARERLAAAQDRAAGLDERAAAAERATAAARSAALTEGDRGLGARWAAMHDHTTESGALLVRLAALAGFVLLALLPLLLRRWRGETSFDRHNAARAVADRAAREAEAAIAVKRAEVHAEAERLRAEQQLTAARLAVEADAAIDRERQRTRVIAAIGGLEIGITEPQRLEESKRPELPAAQATDRKDGSVPHETANLPATVSPGVLAPAAAGGQLVPAQGAGRPAEPKGGGLELPIIGTVPFTDTAARWIRPLVPSFVANALDTATHPLRTARQAFEEVEEITFTLRRTRKVTVDTQDSHAPQQTVTAPVGYQLPPGSPEAWHAHRIASAVVDAPAATHDPRYAALPYTDPRTGHPLPPADPRSELPAADHRELPYRGPRELPPGK